MDGSSTAERRTSALPAQVALVSAATGALAWVIGSQTGGVNLLAGLGAALATTFYFGRWWAVPLAALMASAALLAFPLLGGYPVVSALPFLGLACGLLHALRIERSSNLLLTAASCGAAALLGGLGVNEAMAHRLVEAAAGPLAASVVYSLALGGTVLGGLAVARLGMARESLEAEAGRLRPVLRPEARALVEEILERHRTARGSIRRSLGPSPLLEAQLERYCLRLLQLVERSEAAGAELAPGRAAALEREGMALLLSAERSSDRIVRARYEHSARLVTAQLEQLRALGTGRERVQAELHSQLEALEQARLALLSTRLDGDPRQSEGEVQLRSLLDRALAELQSRHPPLLEEPA